MSKHTPGPWHIWSLGSRDMYIGPSQDIDRPAVAIVPLRVSTRDAQLPNARVVAAAPELLEALIALLDEHPGTENVRTLKARAAIAKANGETT